MIVRAMAGFIATAVQLGAVILLINLVSAIKPSVSSSREKTRDDTRVMNQLRNSDTPTPVASKSVNNNKWTEATKGGGFLSGDKILS